MTKIIALILGALAAVIFASFLLVLIPSLMSLGLHEGSQVPPYTASELRGRQVYMANGCIYCHSQQVRDPIISVDVERGWGRPSYPSDYVHDFPALLGTMRTGPDLINVGTRLADVNWHLIHLFQPRAVVPWSIMPAYTFLFEIKRKPGPLDQLLVVPEAFRPAGRVVVITEDARDLVAYLLSLRRDMPPPEILSRDLTKPEESQNGGG